MFERSSGGRMGSRGQGVRGSGDPGVSSVISRQSSALRDLSPVIIHQTSGIRHQSTVISHHSSVNSYQTLDINHLSSVLSPHSLVLSPQTRLPVTTQVVGSAEVTSGCKLGLAVRGAQPGSWNKYSRSGHICTSSLHRALN